MKETEWPRLTWPNAYKTAEPRTKPKLDPEAIKKVLSEMVVPTIEDPVTKFTTEIRTKFNLEFEEAVTQAFRTVASGLEVDIYVNPEIVYEMLKKHKKRKVYWNFTSIAERYRCPECYAVIGKDDAYCSHCGQALEW